MIRENNRKKYNKIMFRFEINYLKQVLWIAATKKT